MTPQTIQGNSMSEELQRLLEKIQHDGVEKANAEADQILTDAKKKAQAIVDQAKAEAAKLKEGAERESASFEHRAEETIRQAARDTVLKVEQSVTSLLSNLLLKEVNAAMDNPSLIPQLAAEAVRNYLGGKGGIEIAASEKLVDAIRAKLAGAAAGGVTVVMDETLGSGFSVRIAGGRIEHAFTGAAVADALAKQLRPLLAALLKQDPA